MSKKRPTEVGAARGGPHHAPRLRPDQCLLSTSWTSCIRLSQQKKRPHFHLANGHLVPVLWVVQCSMPHVMVQLSKKPNKIKTRMTSKTLLRLQSRVWRGSPFLMEEPRRPFLIHEYPTSTTTETTDVGFTFAGGETDAASTKICLSHAEFPQGILVNVVSNESRPFLTGLDVSREYGLVDDHHYNRVHSHILKCCLPCEILPTRHLALEIMLSKSVESSNVDSALGPYTQGHKRKERFHLNHPYFIFMTRSQTSTNTHPQAKTILLKMLSLLGDTQAGTRLDKRASSSGPLWENVIARITIDDKTGHIMSLEYT